MGAYYDEIEIEEMSWDEEKGVYHSPCPCGDCFEIIKQQLGNYEDIAACSSCSLVISVIYDPMPPGDESEPEGNEEDESESNPDDGYFEDALEDLTIHEEPKPALITVSA